MHVLNKYLLSSVASFIPRSPDDPVADEPVMADPVAVDPDPAAVDPVAADPAAPDADGGDTQPQAARPEIPKWALERIGEETERRVAAEDRERLAIERANSLEEITRRLQAAGGDPAKPVEAERPQAVDQAAVRDEAERLLFRREVENVSTAGGVAFGPQWVEAIDILNKCGANTDQFVRDVMEIAPGEAHKIMFQIAQDGARAVALARMSQTKRIAEITRMVMAHPAPDAKPAAATPALSRAPAPKPSMAPHAPAPDVNPVTPEGDAKMSDKQWNEWFQREGHKTLFQRAG